LRRKKKKEKKKMLSSIVFFAFVYCSFSLVNVSAGGIGRQPQKPTLQQLQQQQQQQGREKKVNKWATERVVALNATLAQRVEERKQLKKAAVSLTSNSFISTGYVGYVTKNANGDIGSVELVGIGKCNQGIPGTSNPTSWRLIWALEHTGYYELRFQGYFDNYCEVKVGNSVSESLGNYLSGANCDNQNSAPTSPPNPTSWTTGNCADGASGYTYQTIYGTDLSDIDWPAFFPTPDTVTTFKNHLNWEGANAAPYFDARCWNFDVTAPTAVFAFDASLIKKYSYSSSGPYPFIWAMTGIQSFADTFVTYGCQSPDTQCGFATLNYQDSIYQTYFNCLNTPYNFAGSASPSISSLYYTACALYPYLCDWVQPGF